MASQNQESEPMVTQDDSVHNSEDLERVKEYLKQVVKKNQDLKEMLLYTTQELEKEKENSKRIVETLTERLMESREMINKLEVQNMRYKKDCMLAVELLQCNRSVDQKHVSTTIRKLSDYTEQVGRENSTYGINPIAVNEHSHTNTDKSAKDEMKNLQQTRPRTSSKKKNKSETNSNHEDMTALLHQQERNDVQDVLGVSPTGDTKPGYNKDILENNGQQKQFSSPQDFVGVKVECSTKDTCMKDDNEYLTDTCQQEDTAVIASKLEITDSESDLNGVEHAGPHSKGSSLNENEIECVTDELTKEDKPLIVKEAETLVKQDFSTPGPNENITKSGRETAEKSQAERQNSDSELHRNVRQSTKSLSKTTTRVEKEEVSPIIVTQEDNEDYKEDKKILSSGAEINEENHAQQLSTNTEDSEIDLPEENDSNEPTGDEVEKMVLANDGEKSSVEDPTPQESDSKSHDGEVVTPVVEADDEALIAEEDTPLV